MCTMGFSPVIKTTFYIAECANILLDIKYLMLRKVIL
jgi:hypothetical protein